MHVFSYLSQDIRLRNRLALSPLPRPTSSSQTSGVDVDGAAPLESLRFSVPMQSKLQGSKHV